MLKLFSTLSKAGFDYDTFAPMFFKGKWSTAGHRKCKIGVNGQIAMYKVAQVIVENMLDKGKINKKERKVLYIF